MTHKKTCGLVLVTIGMSMLGMAAPNGAPEHRYTEPQVYGLRPRADREMALDCIGATGIRARVYPGVVLKVEGVIAGSPADGKFEVGQVLTGVNGRELKGLNPFVVLGEALTRAEAGDGKLVFRVKEEGKPDSAEVVVQIPVLGGYSKTWPLDCEKSRKIIAGAASYYAHDAEFRKQHFKGRGIAGALSCLFLLSTGDDQYLPHVKEYVSQFLGDVEGIGDHTWNNGYNGVACAEYYLRTGDKDVLPILQYYCDNAKERQCFESGWQHWGRGINPGYVAGGLMNPAGAQVLTSLLLAKECGLKVDDDTLHDALRFWYRFAGHGTVPYGDHRGEGGLGSNGKDGMAAAAMLVASGAQGDTGIYKQATKCLSMATLTSYPSLIRGHADEGRGDGIWRGVASSYMLAHEPSDYHTAMNRLTWWYDLSRRPSGAMGMATCQRFDDVGSGAGVALAYTAPLKTLRITGAARSKHAVDFSLPERLWGREADLDFLSIEHGKRYRDGGEDEPIHVPFFTFGSAYSRAGDINKVERQEILRNVYHKRYMIRAQAAKALRTTGAFDELAGLLSDDDPRIRRAALDGMTDYRYWFHVGKNPMKAEQFTPGMVAAITKMLNDETEAWYVIDGALMAMSLMRPAVIGENLPLIMPWTRHEEWWLRQSAFRALAAASADTELLPRVLPVMCDVMLDEMHTQPREGMRAALRRLLQQHKASSPTGKLILDTHMQAAKEREIIPGQRAGEGEYDVGKSVDALLKDAPERSPELAKVMSGRFNVLSSDRITRLSSGFLAASEKLPGEQRGATEERLYTEYRPELLKRMEADGANLDILDAVLGLTALKKGGGAWKAVGQPRPAERIWRYTSFAPLEADALHPREGKRFRDVTLPGGLENWHRIDFDDSAWSAGKAPIGKGVFRERNRDTTFENRSAWGDGEFLVMRSTFDVAAVDYDYYRISVLANQGFHIYLNGHRIHTYIWWRNDPHYRKIMLGANHTKHLRKGTNHLAVYANAAYKDGVPVAQIDVYIEGLKKSDLGIVETSNVTGEDR